VKSRAISVDIDVASISVRSTPAWSSSASGSATVLLKRHLLGAPARSALVAKVVGEERAALGDPLGEAPPERADQKDVVDEHQRLARPAHLVLELAAVRQKASIAVPVARRRVEILVFKFLIDVAVLNGDYASSRS
jgi:hypothetical protein